MSSALSKQIKHHIGGQLVSSGTERTLTVESPIDGSILGEVAIAEASSIQRAVERAKEALESWKRIPAKERVQPMFRFKQLAEAHMDELAKLVSAENGKTPAESEAGIRKGLEVVEYACSLPAIENGALQEVSAGVDCYARRFPLGVVAGVSPFNFPAMVPLWMFPLAIACGNTFILKPSEKVPTTPLRMAALLEEAGLPPGVFNVLQGDRSTVEGLLDHPEIAALSFVGSTPAAKTVYLRGTQSGKRILALGGAKNHLIAVPDADQAMTAKNVTSSATGCAGQRCMAASVLILVGGCDHLLEAICDEMRRVIPGENLGAIITREAKDRIESYISRAEEAGANILVDGRGAIVSGKEAGHYVGPTVIDGVHPSSDCACDEIFGPVLTVLRVDTLDEALAIENANPYGNAASIYTTSGATARHFEQHASAGMIGINIGVPVPREPFSFGGWNDSRFGTGDITGEDGLRFWTQGKKITQKWSINAAQNWMS